MKPLTIATMILAPVIGLAEDKATPHKDYGRFINALHYVEASGRTGQLLGDNGRSLGPLQIGRAYWVDSRVPGRYEQCADLAYSRRVVTAYMRRYAKDALVNGDWEKLARIHNGGPAGHLRKSTLPHWRKVKSALGK